MVTDLQKTNQNQQRQLQEFESKCERLEREVIRVNAKSPYGNHSGEHDDAEVSNDARIMNVQ